MRLNYIISHFQNLFEKNGDVIKEKDIRNVQKSLDIWPLQDYEEMMHERHPVTKQIIKSVIHLRKLKNKHYLEINDLCKNVLFIRYVDLLSILKTVLENLSKNFGITINDPIKEDRGYHGKNPNKPFNKKFYYLKEEYMQQINPDDLEYINGILDHEQEKRLGYRIINK